MDAVQNIDGINVYAHTLVPMGKEKAVKEMVAGGIAPGKDDKEKTDWANKAWPLLEAKVKSVEIEAKEEFQAAEAKRLNLPK